MSPGNELNLPQKFIHGCVCSLFQTIFYVESLFLVKKGKSEKH